MLYLRVGQLELTLKQTYKDDMIYAAQRFVNCLPGCVEGDVTEEQITSNANRGVLTFSCQLEIVYIHPVA
jgi:hypothetical protein